MKWRPRTVERRLRPSTEQARPKRGRKAPPSRQAAKRTAQPSLLSPKRSAKDTSQTHRPESGTKKFTQASSCVRPSHQHRHFAAVLHPARSRFNCIQTRNRETRPQDQTQACDASFAVLYGSERFFCISCLVLFAPGTTWPSHVDESRQKAWDRKCGCDTSAVTGSPSSSRRSFPRSSSWPWSRRAAAP